MVICNCCKYAVFRAKYSEQNCAKRDDDLTLSELARTNFRNEDA